MPRFFISRHGEGKHLVHISDLEPLVLATDELITLKKTIDRHLETTLQKNEG